MAKEDKTTSEVRKETLEAISEVISSDENLQKKDTLFKTELNKAGDLEYHRYEDSNPNDTNPARLTGIFSQDQMDEAIQSRQDDSFYSYDSDRQKPMTPSIYDDDPDTIIEPATVTKGSGATLYVVLNGQITTVVI